MNTKAFQFKSLFLLTLAFFMVLTVRAQEASEMRDRIKAQKVAYITQHLNLSPQEAEQFWPVYNEWEAAKMELRNKNGGRDKPGMTKLDVISDKEAEKLLQQRNQARKQMFELDGKYQEKLLQIIPARKMLKLMELEGDFQRKMLERLKEREPDKRNPRRR